MSRRGALYFNPSSGRRTKVDAMLDFRAAVERRGLDFVALSREVDVFRDVRERMARGQRLFVAAGGDGTINTVLQPVVNTEAELAVIPAGTYNHFARDLGVPADWREALDVACGGEVRQVDTARVNERSFVNNISLGLYPELVAHREKYRGKARWRAYRDGLLWTLRKYPHISLVVDAPPRLEAIRTHVFLVAVNGYDLGRVGVEAPRLSMEGGFLTVYWLPHMPRIKFARALARYVGGTMSSVDGLNFVRTRQLRLQASRPTLKLGMDGEVFEMRTPLVITAAPRTLLVRAPRA